MARALLSKPPMMRMTGVRRARGFTLIELAIVVVIVGVLAVIAVVGYRKLILNGKVTEAQNVIGAIKIAQQDFFAERGYYAPGAPGTFCPTQQACPNCLGGQKTQWATTCGGFSVLAVHVADPVLFGYRTVGGPSYAGDALNPAVGWVTWGANAEQMGRPFFQIHAMADVDNAGPASTMTEFATSSSTNQIFGNNVGE